MSHPFGSFSDDLLYVVLMGPGYGESVLVRLPKNKWLLIDCFKLGDSTLPYNLINLSKGDLLCSIVTHPHDDHIAGIEKSIRIGHSPLVGLADPKIFNYSKRAKSNDLDFRLTQGAKEHALAAISSHWEKNPNLKWDLEGGTHRHFDDLKVTSLFPFKTDSQNYLNNNKNAPNEIATALLLEWKNTIVLLGSDLENPGWEKVIKTLTHIDLSKKHVLKISHHGSLKAQNHIVHQNKPFAFLTPWNRGMSLPRFEEQQGIHAMLKLQEHIHLTALPFKINAEEGSPQKVSRDTILTYKNQASLKVTADSDFQLEEMPQKTSRAKHWILAGLNQNGQIIENRFGSGTWTVFETKKTLSLVKKKKVRSAQKKHHTPNKKKTAKKSKR